MIVVELTPEEAQGYRLAGNAPDSEIPGVLFIVLTTASMNEESALYLSTRLATAALSARNKIKEATRFEIRVVGESPPSS